MENLTMDMMLVMAMIIIAVFLFVVEWIRVDVVAILMMVVLPLLHLVSPKEAFIGLSSNAVVSIIAVIIIGAGLDKTGIINKVVTPIVRIAGGHPSRIVTAISLTVAIISSFMQNIGAAALFLPAVQRISKTLKIPISRLLMPIGFSAILGGTLTLVGSSPLILLNDLLTPFQLEPFGLFDVTPIGLALVGSGIACFALFGKYVLPQGKTDDTGETHELAEPDDNLPELGELYELHTPEDYTHYRDPILVKDLRRRYLVNVVALIEPPDFKVIPPSPNDEVRSNIDLSVYGREKDVRRMAEDDGMMLKERLEVFKNDLADQSAGTVEAVVAPRSALDGKTLKQVKLQALPVAVNQDGISHPQNHVSDLRSVRLSLAVNGQGGHLIAVLQLHLAQRLAVQGGAGCHDRFDRARGVIGRIVLEDVQPFLQRHPLAFDHSQHVFFTAVHGKIDS